MLRDYCSPTSSSSDFGKLIEKPMILRSLGRSPQVADVGRSQRADLGLGFRVIAVIGTGERVS